jgi:hypothetical protein
MIYFLVWVQGMANQPEIQKWADFALDTTAPTFKAKVLSYRPLSLDEQELTLNVLERLYPFQGVTA